MLRYSILLGLTLISLAQLGCGSGATPSPVAGTITIRKKPEAKLLIQFTATQATGGKLASGSATSGEGGKFEITGDGGKPGLPPGDYIVTVVDRNSEVADEDLGKGKPLPVNRVDKKYLSTDEKINPLKVKVEAGKTSYDLNLD